MTTTPAEIDTWRKVPREHHTLEFKAERKG
jgi:hypothetical protein